MRCLAASAAAVLLLLGVLASQILVHAPARIHIRPAVFTAQECDSMVAAAERSGAWTRERHKNFPTEDIPIRSVPVLRNISDAVERTVLPLLRSSFALAASEPMSIDDLFLIRYSPTGQDELPMHTDGSTLSFSIALSPPEQYGGGGIDFDLMPSPIITPQGSLVMHPSRLMHRGATVVSGRRYVLVGFVSVGDGAVFTFPWSGSGRTAAASLHGLWARCVRVVRPTGDEGAAAVGFAEPEDGGHQHCRSFIGALSGVEEEDLSVLVGVNAALLAVVALSLVFR